MPALFWEAQGLQTSLVTFEVKPLLIEHLRCTVLFVCICEVLLGEKDASEYLHSIQ